MRFYDIALFVFIFVLMMSLVEEMGLFTATMTISGSWNQSSIQQAWEKLNESVAGTTFTAEGTNYFFESIKLTIQGFIAFVTALVKATVLVPELFRTILYSLGMPADKALLFGYSFGTMVYFVYVVGLIQFASGRSIKEAV